ncbi:MAG: hypothetical protein QOE45_2666 [Frankiaceae bacterium]|nr:hypothetical protein [Frankiaceae bacterium]
MTPLPRAAYRPCRRRRPTAARGPGAAAVRLALAAALLGIAVPAAGVASAAPCPGRSAGRWERLAPPPGTAQVLPLRTPCALLAVGAGGAVSRTSGAAWAPAPTPPVARAFADARSGTVVAALRSGGVVVSRDDGRTFAAPTLGPSGTAVAAAVSIGAPPAIVVGTVLDPLPLPPVTTLWRSTDGGATFAVAGTVAARPVTLTFDSAAPDALWLAATADPGAGVWRSPDTGTTWRPVLAGLPAYDVDTAGGSGGGLVVAARADGLWRSTTGGTTWIRTPAAPLSAARVDSGGPGVVAVADRRPVRIDDPAFPGRVRPLTHGLPPGCPADALASDAALPATFVLRCGDAWYAQPSAADPHGAGDKPGPPAPGDVRVLTELARLSLPTDDGTHSGSLAFDGRALYYAGEFRTIGAVAPIDTVHLMSPRDGRALGTLEVGHPAKRLTYDSRRDRLYVDDGASMWHVSARGGRAVAAFPSTLSRAWSFDASTRTLLGTDEGDEERSMFTLNESGSVVARCSLKTAVPVLSSPYFAPSAVVAAADGAYVVLEDDTTVLRVGRDCALRATYVTKRFSESPMENDELVCDPLTFAPRTALWLRDGVATQVVAYALPEGYCPFQATLRVTAPTSVVDGAAARVCATLMRTGRGEPIPGQAVTLDVDGVLLAAAPTDAAGRTCATGVLATVRPAVARGVRVRARYAGTAQWTAATATASITVLPAVSVPRVPAVPPAVPDTGGGSEPVPGRAGPPAPPNPPADPAHVPHPQSNPQAQQNPGQQPGSQAGLAPDDEEAPALVLADDRAGDEVYAMSRRDAGPAPAAVLGAALVTATAGWALRFQTASAPVVLRPGRRRPRDSRRRGHAVRRGR